MSQNPPQDGLGFIENADYLHAIDGTRGFLTITGWYSPVGGRVGARVTGRARIGAHEYSFPCHLARPDVIAYDGRLARNCGFDVTLTLPGGLQGAQAVPIGFYADGVPIGTLAPQVGFPEQQVAAEAATLPPLRVKKLDNLILNERERLSHVIQTTALPVIGHIDPCFSCQLHCPNCAGEMIRRDGYTMQIMTVPQIEKILQNYGDGLARIWLSLWGEPLLNKHLPELIERCKRHDIWVLISTNLSVPMKPDAIEALVSSGVDSLILSIDGATQETYEIYRKGGELDLVIENIRQLVAAKRRLGRPTPYLYWRYLEFEWNRHEIEAARTLATALGVDQFGVEPGITAPPISATLHGHKPDRSSHIPEPGIEAGWRKLAARQRDGHGYFGCDYLYSSISINANGQVHPCCYVVAPYDTVGNAAEPVDRVRNGPVLRDARRMFGAIANGTTAGMAARDPCVACGVVDSTDGHVLAQANFRTLFDHLMGRKVMPW